MKDPELAARPAGGAGDAGEACRILSDLWERQRETYGLTRAEGLAALREALERQACRDGLETALARLSHPTLAGDVLLARAYRLGTLQGVETFCKAYRGLVRHAALQSVPVSEVAEVESEVWAVLWEKIPRYSGISTLRTWLTVVVSRWLRDRARGQPPPVVRWTSDKGQHLVELAASPGAETPRPALCAEFSRALDRSTAAALQALGAEERHLLRLRLLEALPLEQVRLRLEIYRRGEPLQPVYGITRRVQRAARKLRQALHDELARRGYGPGDCQVLLAACEEVEARLAGRLANFLRDAQGLTSEESNP
jgi:RNA polymerase sigma factor (sigma-70 family)